MTTDAGTTDASTPRPLVLVTGMSGAGNSSTLKTLEDLGYEAIDNLPLRMLPGLVGETGPEGRPLAIGVDSRTRDFDPATLISILERLRAAEGFDVRLLLLESDDEMLQQRYTETRRRHPLAVDRPVLDGIQRERQLIAPLREHATRVLDTTLMTIHDLRRLVSEEFALGPESRLFIQVMSFSFRHGLPREADLVFDVRFFSNPHWEPDLRPLTGLDEAVQGYIARDPGFSDFIARLEGLLSPLLPRYTHEGKSYLTIAIGCTGGKHRSVFVAERLASWLRDTGHRVGVQHRDLPRTAKNA